MNKATLETRSTTLKRLTQPKKESIMNRIKKWAVRCLAAVLIAAFAMFCQGCLQYEEELEKLPPKERERIIRENGG